MNNNPFMHEAATNIEDSKLVDMFIDNEHSHILNSQKNIFIIGNRGSGKSMLMRYTSLPIQLKNNSIQDINNIGIYISCMTPLFMRIDQRLNDDKFQSAIVSEHMLVLTMAERFLSTFLELDESIISEEDLLLLKEELEFYFDVNLNETRVLKDFHRWIIKNLIDTQKHLDISPSKFVSEAHTYSSLMMPLIQVFKEVSSLKKTHFMFLIDDGQMLSTTQQISLNSWISYRDTSSVSFKIAITTTDEYSFLTVQESVILENHDYITLDLERDFFSGKSTFVEFAKKIIEKRLELYNIPTRNVEDFFEVPKSFTNELSLIRKKFINGDYPEREDWEEEQRRKNASKFVRSIYFRLNSETEKANIPKLAYTGFDTLTNISTGVIRNLLVPCSIMYEKEKELKGETVDFISAKTQYETLFYESRKAWEKIDELSVKIVDCTHEHTVMLRRVLDNFGKYLQQKLLDPKGTEKKILSFTIHDLEKNQHSDKIKKVIKIGIQGGLIYTRIGPDHNGGRTMWYTPNRILWPSLNLDPVGQNGRKNFPGEQFYKMMTNDNYANTIIKEENSGYVQGELSFDK